MQYTVFLSMVASALAAKSLGVVSLRSGSKYQFAGLFEDDKSILVSGGGTEAKLVLNDDGTLGETSSNKYLTVGDKGAIVLSSKPQKGFSVDGQYLEYDGKQEFAVCPDNKLSFGEDICSGSLGISLRVMSQKDAPEFKPGSSETPSTTTCTTKAAATTTTKTEPTKPAEPKAPSAQTAANVEPGKKFGIIAIASGSQVQNAAIKQVDSHPHVFSVGGNEGNDLTLSFQDDKTSLVDSNGRGVNLDSNTGEVGSVAPFGRAPATTGFSIADGELTFDNSKDFYACPSGNGYSLSHKECVGGTGIGLKVIYA